jgi:hypothetical protein
MQWRALITCLQTSCRPPDAQYTSPAAGCQCKCFLLQLLLPVQCRVLLLAVMQSSLLLALVLQQLRSSCKHVLPGPGVRRV